MLQLMQVDLKGARELWLHFRPVALEFGLNDTAAEIDALLADGDRALEEPDTFRYRCDTLRKKLVSEMTATGMPIPREHVDAWFEGRNRAVAKRIAQIEEELGSPRALLYRGFLIIARVGLPAAVFEKAVEGAPSVAAGATADLLQAVNAKSDERRLKAWAQATLQLAENVYKRQLETAWELVLALGWAQPPTKPPQTLGQFMNACKRGWSTAQGGGYPLDDFLVWDALQVRNAAAHPTWTRFDPATCELVVVPPGKTEQRYTEQQLKSVLTTLFHKCRLFQLALLKESGRLDDQSKLITLR